MIRSITQRLYADTPQERLYHYTTFSGLLGIVDRCAIWASDIRYMNDSAELKHAADLIRSEISHRISEGHPNPTLLNRFQDWVAHRITNGHMVFAASFRANGNLLSQWRGYSALGKGVSLGFSPQHILSCAEKQHWQVGRCIYEPAQQRELIRQVVDSVEKLAANSRDPEQHQLAFAEIETDLLRIAAILKHPSFREEDEWRVVSPVITDFLESPVRFREGAFMLVPYIEFGLTASGKAPIALEHLYLGPTPNIELSLNSLKLYLAKQGIEPSEGIDYCQIPFRQR